MSHNCSNVSQVALSDVPPDIPQVKQVKYNLMEALQNTYEIQTHYLNCEKERVRLLKENGRLKKEILDFQKKVSELQSKNEQIEVELKMLQKEKRTWSDSSYDLTEGSKKPKMEKIPTLTSNDVPRDISKEKKPECSDDEHLLQQSIAQKIVASGIVKLDSKSNYTKVQSENSKTWINSKKKFSLSNRRPLLAIPTQPNSYISEKKSHQTEMSDFPTTAEATVRPSKRLFGKNDSFQDLFQTTQAGELKIKEEPISYSRIVDSTNNSDVMILSPLPCNEVITLNETPGFTLFYPPRNELKMQHERDAPSDGDTTYCPEIEAAMKPKTYVWGCIECKDYEVIYKDNERMLESLSKHCRQKHSKRKQQQRPRTPKGYWDVDFADPWA